MKYTLLCLCVLMAGTIRAQLRPDFLPEDVGTPGGQIVRCYCKPGVRNKSRSKGLELAYTNMGRGTFTDEENSVTRPYTKFSNWSRFEFDLKGPVLNKQNFKFLVGYKYTGETFNINNFGNDFRPTFERLDRVTLKSSNISAIITKPINEKNYMAFRLRYTANGDFDGVMDFSQRYGIYKAMGVFGFKVHDDFEWGFGINYSNSFRDSNNGSRRRTNILPFVIYNRTFVNDWGIEAAFPGYIYGRYNQGPNTIFLFGTEFSSDSYRIDVPLSNEPTLDYAINQSSLLFLARWEQQIVPWIWGNIKAGYQMSFSTDFESKAANTTTFLVDPSNSPIFEIGIFISPPDGAFK